MARNRNRNNNQQRSFRNRPAIIAVQPRRRNRGQRRGRQQPNQKVTQIGRILRQAGSAAGALFGQPTLGRNLGAGISRVFGQGDYMMNTPMTNSLMTAGPPAFSPLSSGFRIKHREFIKDLKSSVGFTSEVFRINPGLPDLFPWLSRVAPNFEEYKIHGCIIWLNSTSATAVSSTNTALGVWGVVTQYDAAEPDFINKQQCENYVGSQAAGPSKSIMHGIECKPGANVLDKYYVRTGELAGDLDVKFYDMGKVEYFTQGAQAESTIGELWISYDIEFTKPRLSDSQALDSDIFDLGQNWSNTFPLGTTSLKPKVGGGQFSEVTVDADSQTLVFHDHAPAGFYMITTHYWGILNGQTAAGTLTPVGPLTFRTPNPVGAYSFYSAPAVGVNANQMSFDWLVYKSSGTQSASLRFSKTGWALPGEQLNSHMVVTPMGDQYFRQTITKVDVRKLMADFMTLQEQVTNIMKRPLASIPEEEVQLIKERPRTSEPSYEHV